MDRLIPAVNWIRTNNRGNIAQDLQAAIDEIESLRKQFMDMSKRCLDELKKSQAVMEDTRDRLDRAGL